MEDEVILLMSGPKLLRRNFSSETAPLPPSSTYSTKALKRQQKMASLQEAIKEEKDGGNVGGKVVFKRELPAVARLPDVDSVEVRRKQQQLKQKEEAAAAALAAIPLPTPAAPKQQQQQQQKKKENKPAADATKAPSPPKAQKQPLTAAAAAVDPVTAAASAAAAAVTAPKKAKKPKLPKPANATLPAVEAFITSLPLPPNVKATTRNGHIAGISPRPKAPKDATTPSSLPPSSLSSSLSAALPPAKQTQPPQLRPNTTYLSSSPSPFALAKSAKKMYISRRGEITVPNTGAGSASALASLLSLKEKDGSKVTPAELKGVVNGCLRRQVRVWFVLSCLCLFLPLSLPTPLFTLNLPLFRPSFCPSLRPPPAL